MTEEDRKFLRCIYNRMVYVHNESPSLDYMKKLRSMFMSEDIDQEITETLNACKIALAKASAVKNAQKN